MIFKKLRSACATALVAVICTAPAISHAQDGPRGACVIYPVVFSRNSGSDTSRKTAISSVREVLQKGGYTLVSDTVAARSWHQLGIRNPMVDDPSPMTDLVRFGNAVKARYVVSPVFDFHSRSIWVDLGPKTVSTATVDIVITDVVNQKTVYSREDVSARSDEKFNAIEAGADLLLSPFVTVVSGGPKTPHEQRAVQIAVAKALHGWIRPSEQESR